MTDSGSTTSRNAGSFLRVLFTGYAPVHYLCFKPLADRLRAMSGVELRVSGGLRTKDRESGHIEYDEHALYDPFDIPDDQIIPTHELASHSCDVLFAANTKMIAPNEVGARVQIFHGVSFRNKAVREDNTHADHYFIVGPYMCRRFAESNLIHDGDPRALPIGFMKTDALLDGSLDRTSILQELGVDGRRPVLLYVPTGQKYNSLETMGDEVIRNLAASDRYDIVLKPHDHPKNPIDPEWLASIQGPRVHLAGSDLNVIPLMYASNLLMTDASSVSNEYALLDRPLVFLDVPKLIKRAKRAEGSMVDMDTWGRRIGPIVTDPANIVETIERSLTNPAEHANVRQELAGDVFYNPGHAANAAERWFVDKFLSSVSTRESTLAGATSLTGGGIQ